MASTASGSASSVAERTFLSGAQAGSPAGRGRPGWGSPLFGLGPKEQTRVPSNAGGSRLGLDTTGQVTGHPKPAGAFTTPAIVKKGNEIQRRGPGSLYERHWHMAGLLLKLVNLTCPDRDL